MCFNVVFTIIAYICAVHACVSVCVAGCTSLVYDGLSHMDITQASHERLKYCRCVLKKITRSLLAHSILTLCRPGPFIVLIQRDKHGYKCYLSSLRQA